MSKFKVFILLLPISLAFVSCADRSSDAGAVETPQATATIPPTITPIAPTPTPAPMQPLRQRLEAANYEPDLEILFSSDEAVDALHPGLVEVEITTIFPAEIALVVTRAEDDGTIQMINSQPLLIDGPEVNWPDNVRAGITRHLAVWDATGLYLTDGSAGDYVLPEWLDVDEAIVRGTYRSSTSDDFIDVRLAIEWNELAIAGIFDAESGDSISPQPGDIFQTWHYFVQDGSVPEAETGTLLLFDDDGQLSLEVRPLPAGDYTLHFQPGNEKNNPETGAIGFTVEDALLEIDQQTYVDPQFGFQIRLPNRWSSPQYMDGLLVSRISDSTLQLTVSVQPDMQGTTSTAFRSEVLGAFGDVQILYEEALTIGDVGTSWTAYGYEGVDGERVGVFVAVVKDSYGYLIDLEGAKADQEGLLSAAGLVLNSLAFRPIGLASRAGRWTEMTIDGHAISAYKAFLHQVGQDGWNRFISNDESSFIALMFPEDSFAQISDPWSLIQDEDGHSYRRSNPYQLQLGDLNWDRFDYVYVNDADQDIIGFFMSTSTDRSHIVAWAESPEDRFDEMEKGVFLPMLVDIRPSLDDKD